MSKTIFKINSEDSVLSDFEVSAYLQQADCEICGLELKGMLPSSSRSPLLLSSSAGATVFYG